MPIKRCSAQKNISLEDFYIELSKSSSDRYIVIGKRMLDVIKLINSIFIETDLIGLTSHERLLILVEDNWKSSWYVNIGNIGTDKYQIEYLMPKQKEPWSNATVRGEAKNIQDLKCYLLTAMERSEAWKGNNELEFLIKNIDN